VVCAGLCSPRQLFKKKPRQKYPSGAGFRKSRAQNSFLKKSRAKKQDLENPARKYTSEKEGARGNLGSFVKAKGSHKQIFLVRCKTI